MIQDKIFFDEKDPTGVSYNTPFTVYGSYEGRLWSKTPTGSIKYYTQNSDLSVYATTGSNQFSGSQTVTGSLTVTGGITGSVTTASYVEYTGVANKPALVSSSAQIVGYNVFATTGSNQFNGSQAITGSLTVTGQVVAQTLNVQQVTSSIVYSSGSNIFGNSLGNTQQFTGSLQVSGSNHYVLGNTGIGTTSPSANLHVVRANDGGSGTPAVILSTGNGANDIVRFQDGTTTVAVVKNSGNMGIGTTSPDVTGFGWRTLTIKGGAASGDAGVLELQSPATTGAANLGIIAFLDGSNRNAQIAGQRDGATNSGLLSFTTWNAGTGAERMRITAGGTIEVRGGNILNIYRTDNTRALQLSTTSNECLIDAWEATSEPLMLRSNGSGGRIVFHTNGGERMRITSDGYVLIGETNPPAFSTPSGGKLLMLPNAVIVSGLIALGSPYTQNIQIDIVYNNWGGNNVLGLVDMIITLREYANIAGTAFGKVFAVNGGSGATFTSFNTTNVTTSQCSVTATSGGNYTLRITIDPSNVTDRGSFYLTIPNAGGTGSTISSITVSYV